MKTTESEGIDRRVVLRFDSITAVFDIGNNVTRTQEALAKKND